MYQGVAILCLAEAGIQLTNSIGSTLSTIACYYTKFGKKISNAIEQNTIEKNIKKLNSWTFQSGLLFVLNSYVALKAFELSDK